MKLIIIAVLGVPLFLECTKREGGQTVSIETGLSPNQKSAEHSADTTQIIDNSFIQKAEIDLTLERFRNIYKPREVSKQIFQNKYEPDKKDTLISFHQRGDSISFYMAPANSFPYRLVLTSDKVMIDNCIRIGVSKDVFIKYFKVDKLANTVIVEDMGRFSRFTFCFNNNRLAKIIYETLRIE